ncbi:hypothetical protein C5167_007207 [Papaver somniferum]|uniref:F-box domain-containing protein n=1 Tax=Papaver somniferum TaxID=3469 RepID=A0A4Y7JIT0_PAPSO|nr:uncharacterized protein LOC113271800 [Papaver somniferum]RZC59912.1 hypothetical protein C5167_007207 [Papaver somniferum]
MGDKAKRYGRRLRTNVNPLKLSLSNKAFNEKIRKRRTRESSSSGNGNSEVIIDGSCSSNSEEHKIIRQSEDNKKMKMGNNWKPMAKCSVENIGSSSSLSNSEENEIIRHSENNKKMKMKMDNNWKPMAKCSSGNKVLSSSSIFDHYRIMRGILSRLPVKSLMRFKCVSKHWQFSICQDQGLIDLHFSQSKQHCPDLFLVVPRYTVNRSGRYPARRNTRGYAGARECKYQQSLLLGNLFESGTSPAIRTTVRKSEQKPFHYTEILPPVNGLICFVNRRSAAVCILNPSTRERTPWIVSSLRQNKKYNFVEEYARAVWLPTYFFGFDPATKQHKVVCAWCLHGQATGFSGIDSEDDKFHWTGICEVLTVGENTWRNIDEKVPFTHYPVKVSICSNGFIYWGSGFVGIPENLNAFDVGQEKFKVITVPQHIKDKCKNPPGGHCGPYQSLIEVGGHISLLQRWTDKVVKLWICGDDTSTGSYSKWTEITMNLPFQWGDRHGRFPYFHGVAGEDRIIIESYPTMDRLDINKVCLYSYDWKKKTSTKKAKDGVVSELSSVSLYSGLAFVSLFRSFAESLWPVRDHQFRHRQETEKARLRLNVNVTAALDSAPAPAPIESFTNMCLHESIMKDISFHKYSTPTSIQAQAMPVALNGRDLLCCAETGSGKTAAFAIPMIQHCLAQPSVRRGDGPLALVLAPTREHAQQIEKEVKAFSRSLESFRTATVVGGTNMAEQKSELRAGVNIVVATPERFIDHLQQGNTCLSRISFVVMDEADILLDMGFEPQIREVMRNVPIKRQTLLFSATMPVEIEALAQKYLSDPVQVKVGKVQESEKVNMEDLH